MTITHDDKNIESCRRSGSKRAHVKYSTLMQHATHGPSISSFLVMADKSASEAESPSTHECMLGIDADR